jgi:DNA helicase II / ATP-dependent DNA helicase PcrA
VPQRFYVTQQAALGDRHLYGSISRFLPPALHGLFEQVEPSAPAALATASIDNATPTVDLGARVRQRWA